MMNSTIQLPKQDPKKCNTNKHTNIEEENLMGPTPNKELQAIIDCSEWEKQSSQGTSTLTGYPLTSDQP